MTGSPIHTDGFPEIKETEDKLMAYFRCSPVKIGKLPDSVTISLSGLGSYESSSASAGKVFGKINNLRIPTMGYQKADITATGSAARNNVDISNEPYIDVSAYSGWVDTYWHAGHSRQYGDGRFSITVKLHN